MTPNRSLTKALALTSSLLLAPLAAAQDPPKPVPPAPEAAKPAEPSKDKDSKESKEKSDMALDAIKKFTDEKKIDTKKAGWKTSLPQPPKVAFDPKHDYFWMLSTNKGDIKVKLMPDVAPMHVSSTIYLTQLGFYDDLLFHRVIPQFMAQGGCPLGTGTGSPGYKFAGEFSPKVRHDRGGLLSMANAGPGTDGSQFFLTFVATPHLDDKHTIYGEVVDGLPVLKELERKGSSPTGKTSETLKINKATIVVAPKS